MAAASPRLARLDALKAALGPGDVFTTAALAADLGVSERTLHRDLATLRDSGVPIEGERGRGGGIRLEPGWSLGRVHLNEAEALSMLLGLAIAEKVGSSLLLDHLDSVRRKVAAAFAPSQARRIDRLRHRVIAGGPASPSVLASYTRPPASISAAVTRSFLFQKVASIEYSDEAGQITTRDVEIQFLHYAVPVWYALAWDRLRDDIRYFRIDRIRGISERGEEFRLRAAEPFLAAGDPAARPI